MSPAGFVHELASRLGAETTITRAEFLERGLRDATSYDTAIAGTAVQLANRLEEVFEAAGRRGGFMLCHIVSLPGDLQAIADLLDS